MPAPSSGIPLRNSDLFEVVGRGGFYKAAGVGGAIMGRGVNSQGIGLIDDPYKSRAQAESVRERQTINDWFFSTYTSRIEMGARQILLNTRWHAGDLSAVTIDRAQTDPTSSQWFCLVFPAILDCAPGPGDPRSVGEALWEARLPLSRLRQIRASMGEYDFEALHQQRPIAKKGAIIQVAWVQRCDALPDDLVDYTISVDLPFKDKNDFAAFGVYARRGSTHYVVEMVNQRMAFTEQVAMFRLLSNKYPHARAKLVEDAANGAALVDYLRREISGIVPFDPKKYGSKELRLQAVAPMFEAGNICVPKAAWADEFISQLCTFPASAHDDIVDSVSQYLLYSQKNQYDFSRLRAFGVKRESTDTWQR